MKRIEMIGAPLSHVKTPDLLNARLAEAGVDLRVTLREVGLADLADYVATTRRDPDVVGLVVTTPLKIAICGHLTHKTALVASIGACNCVRIEEGAWIGANFDGFGFSRALAEADLSVAGKRVLLMGCGGAGKAIAARIVEEGAAELAIADPARERTAAFAAGLKSDRIRCAATAPVERFDIVVNATPVGMNPDDPSPVPDEIIAQCGAVVDIVISTDRSRFGRQVLASGKTLVEGGAMVRGQTSLMQAFLLSDAASEAAAAGCAASLA